MFRKYQAVFTSRWKAAIWAAGVCLTAYCTVPSQDQSEARQAKLQPKHASPWAIQKQ
jgi:hypothetical protein|uniref:hypothetical protein n=1 Tax=Altererythrobacter segetis TaxID=1104773 RepID=UPI0014095F94|nr:hypothetical protein [Altererythrobacter segetis]